MYRYIVLFCLVVLTSVALKEIHFFFFFLQNYKFLNHVALLQAKTEMLVLFYCFACYVEWDVEVSLWYGLCYSVEKNAGCLKILLAIRICLWFESVFDFESDQTERVCDTGVTSWEKVPFDMFDPQSFRPACTSRQFAQSLCCLYVVSTGLGLSIQYQTKVHVRHTCSVKI